MQLSATPPGRVPSSITSFLALHRNQEISLGIPCLPLSTSLTVEADLMKAVSWKTTKGNQEFSEFLFSRTGTDALKEQYMLGAY